MRKNRRITNKMSVIATTTMRFGAIIVFLVLMVILNVLSSSSCSQLMKTKGDLERELAKLEESFSRESSRWEELKTPERIEKALSMHGLKMTLPRPDQNVHVRKNGVPVPGQLALKRFGKGNAAMAEVQPQTMRRRAGRRN